jgi:hypothetical protein
MVPTTDVTLKDGCVAELTTKVRVELDEERKFPSPE